MYFTVHSVLLTVSPGAFGSSFVFSSRHDAIRIPSGRPQFSSCRPAGALAQRACRTGAGGEKDGQEGRPLDALLAGWEAWEKRIKDPVRGPWITSDAFSMHCFM